MNATLIMLPGLLCDARVFAAQVSRFPGAVAFSGYKASRSLTDMAAMVLDSAPPRFALLGHSMGARVAFEIMRRAPERVERLALVSTGMHGVRPGEAEKRHALRDLGAEHGIEALVDSWLPPMVAPARQGDIDLMGSMRRMCIEAGLDAFENQIAALLTRPEVAELLPAIDCPTLVAVGSADIWSPPEQHHRIANAIPGAKLVIIPGSGHMLPMEDPNALNEEIAQWLAGPAT